MTSPRQRSTSVAAAYRGVMSPPTPRGSVPALMSMPGRPARGFMRPDPNVPAFDWSRDGVAFLWGIALMLGLVLWVALLGHPIGRR